MTEQESDYLKTGCSIVVAAVSQLRQLCVLLLPYLFIVASFGIFVLVNGGVVLGT